MRINHIFSSALLLTFLLSNCATTGVTIKTLKDDATDYTSYTNFYLLPEPPTEENPHPTLIKSFPRRAVENAVIKQLEKRNYTQVRDQDAADMLVAIQFTLKDEKRTYDVTTTTNYGHNGYNPYRSGHYYRSYYGYRTFTNRETIVEQYRKGNMIIDLIDKKENALIWEAFAQGRGETELDAIEAKVNRVVAEAFLQYPIVVDQDTE